ALSGPPSSTVLTGTSSCSHWSVAGVGMPLVRGASSARPRYPECRVSNPCRFVDTTLVEVVFIAPAPERSARHCRCGVVAGSMSSQVSPAVAITRRTGPGGPSGSSAEAAGAPARTSIPISTASSAASGVRRAVTSGSWSTPRCYGAGRAAGGGGRGLRGSSTAPSRSIVVAMSSPQPPYEQVRRESIEQVRNGELTPGDRLPAIRTHAAELGLAAGTVARAYKLLEESRIIVTRRGAGTTIAPGAAAEARRLAEAAQREAGGPVDAGLAALFAGPIAAARARGARDVEILASVRAALAGESGGGPA